jgi:hypothetical protein
LGCSFGGQREQLRRHRITLAERGRGTHLHVAPVRGQAVNFWQFFGIKGGNFASMAETVTVMPGNSIAVFIEFSKI